MHRRPVLLSLLLIGVTIAAGLMVRMAHFGLPGSLVKYGGSLLWALMVYWIVSTLRPFWPTLKSGIAAGVLAVSVELSQLHHSPALDSFRATGAGALLLGRVFSIWDIVAYLIAVALGAWVDHAIRRRLHRRTGC